MPTGQTLISFLDHASRRHLASMSQLGSSAVTKTSRLITSVKIGNIMDILLSYKQQVEPLRRFSHMSHYLPKTFVRIFTVGAALTCSIAFAATVTAETVAPKNNSQSTALAKSSPPIDLFLPDAAIRASQMPFSWFLNKQQANVVSNQEKENKASSSTPALFPGQGTHPTTSLMIGWLPPKEGTSTTGLFQPGPYQYATTGTEGGCQTMDRTASNTEATTDVGRKGLHLPAGWILGMCLHY
jgi:hypothetical protein